LSLIAERLCCIHSQIRGNLLNGNPEPSLTRNSFEGVETRREWPNPEMVWLRDSPDHKQRKLAVKTVVGKKILWTVMSVPVRSRPEVLNEKDKVYYIAL